MKKYIFFLLVAMYSFECASQNNLKGKISNFTTAEGLPGATIYINDLKKGTTSDSIGNYIIENIPSGKFLIEFRYLGFETQILKIEIDGTAIQDISLEESHTELKDVMITGMSAASEKAVSPVSSISIDKLKLQETPSTNIIDAISNTPGLSQVSSGAGISKPIIRGLGFNRVLVLQNNIRQEGQQWGEEHGIEIDEFSVNKIEIIKGPGSLAYGSDAMAGVINILSPDPIQKGKQQLNFLSTYHTNNSLQGYSLMYEGNKNDVYWNLQGTRKQAANYLNKYDGKVFNSGFNEWNGNGMLGLSKKWGYAQLNFSSFNQEVGIIEGERDSLGKFTEHEIINDSTIEELTVDVDHLKGYEIHSPKQKINHQKVSLNGKLFKNNSVFQYTIGFQQNQRREIELHIHDGLAEEEASIHQLLNTFNYDFNFHRHLNDWETTIGINGYNQKGLNLGEEFIIPEYKLNDVGIYAITQKSINKLHLAGGLRYNFRNVSTQSLYLNEEGISTISDTSAEMKFTAFERSFSSLVYSAGLSYKFSKILIGKLNISGGFRAPNLSELGANGAHHGTFRYEIGNADLKPETSLQTDFALNVESEHISLEFSAFYNQINNFIFFRKLLNTSGSDSLIMDEGEVNSVFKFVQDDAQLFGGEITLDIHPHPFDWLHFENSFSFVEGSMKNFTDSTKYLPFIPAPRLQTELRAHFHESQGNNFTFKGSKLQNFFVSANMNYHFAQFKIYSAYNTETSTPSYILFNAGIGFDMKNKKDKTLFSFIFSAQNLTDVAFQNHLSRLKYLSLNESTGRNGVFNMGRNFMIKLIVPIGLK